MKTQLIMLILDSANVLTTANYCYYYDEGVGITAAVGDGQWQSADPVGQ